MSLRGEIINQSCCHINRNSRISVHLSAILIIYMMVYSHWVREEQPDQLGLTAE